MIQASPDYADIIDELEWSIDFAKIREFEAQAYRMGDYYVAPGLLPRDVAVEILMDAAQATRAAARTQRTMHPANNRRRAELREARIMGSPEVVQKAYSVLHDIRRRDEYGTGYDFEALGEFFECDEHAKIWIIKGVVAWGETTAWIGPPGSLKSALMSDLAISVAYNRSWHGQKYKAQGQGVGVLYFAFERADLVKRRLEAQAKTLGIELETGSSIVVVPGIIDLSAPESVKKAATTVKNVESFTGDMIGQGGVAVATDLLRSSYTLQAPIIVR